MFQNWIENENGYLFGVSHWPNIGSPKGGVLLLSGFSQSLCDSDYFMSKLARRLINQNYFVLQLDPIGHGDSGGNLEDVTITTLRSSVKTGIEYIKRQLDGPIFCVGRGLSATIINDSCISKKVVGVACIDPYCIEGSYVRKLWSDITNKAYEITDLCSQGENKEQKKAFFNALGAENSNLYGQIISGQLIMDLMDYSPLREINLDKNLRINENSSTQDKQYPNSSYSESISFHNDPQWQHNVIECICSKIDEKMCLVDLKINLE